MLLLHIMQDYNNCMECLGYKGEAASLMQPYHDVDMEAFSQKTPTYNSMKLKDATKEFLKDYINSAAVDYGTTTKSQLRKNLNMTREGLTKLIKGINAEEGLEDISEKIGENSQYFMQDDLLGAPKDPISRYFVQEARKNPEGYDLKRDVAQFKRTYANNMARTFGFYNASKNIGYENAIELDTRDVIKYGMNDAAETLGISKRRMLDLVKDYYKSLCSSDFEKEQSEELTDKAAERAGEQLIKEMKRIEEKKAVEDLAEKERARMEQGDMSKRRKEPLENILNLH